MRLSVLLVGVASTLALHASAFFDRDDHQIFRVRDDLSSLEGAGVTFYDFLEVPPSASQQELQQAFRKKSRLIHPDKARSGFISTYGKTAEKKSASGSKKKPGVTVRKRPSQREIDRFTRDATTRYQLLQAANAVLTGPQRERYDHFLRNGFPKWRGTGYYYERYRPGFGTVLTGLFVFGGGCVHYFVLVYSWKRQRDFVERYIKRAREMAWGDSSGIPGIGAAATSSARYAEANGTGQQNGGIGADEDSDNTPQPRNRKEKRAMEKAERKEKGRPASKAAAAARTARQEGISTPQDASLTSGPVGTKKRVVAENGKVLIVDSVGNVYLEEETPEGAMHEYLLDPDEIPKPTIYDTAVFRLPGWIYNKTVARITGKPTLRDIVEEHAEEEGNDETVPDAVQAALASSPTSEKQKRKAKIRQR